MLIWATKYASKDGLLRHPIDQHYENLYTVYFLDLWKIQETYVLLLLRWYQSA